MPIKSELKAKLIMIKSKFFSFSKIQKERDSKSIEELMFMSVFEDDIFITLKNKCIENYWLFLTALTILEMVDFIKSILN